MYFESLQFSNADDFLVSFKGKKWNNFKIIEKRVYLMYNILSFLEGNISKCVFMCICFNDNKLHTLVQQRNLKINVTMFTYACSIFYTAVCTKSELAWHICWKIQFPFFYQKSAFFAQIAFAFLKEIDCIQGDLGNVGHLKDNLVTEYLFIIF